MAGIESDVGMSRPGGDDGRQAGIGQGLAIVAVGFLPILAIVSLAPAVQKILQHFSSIPNAMIYVPMMVGAPGLVIAALAPVAGVVTDKFGRRMPLLIATFFYGLFGVAPLLLESLPGGSFTHRAGEHRADPFRTDLGRAHQRIAREPYRRDERRRVVCCRGEQVGLDDLGGEVAGSPHDTNCLKVGSCKYASMMLGRS